MKKYGKLILNTLPLLGIGFFIYYIYKKGFDWEMLWSAPMSSILCVLILILVFLIQAKNWQQVLSAYHIEVTISRATYSQFSSVFYKYIPGKVWAAIGKASSLNLEGKSVVQLSTIAFILQLLYTTWGLLLGSLALWFVVQNDSLRWIILVSTIIGMILLWIFLSKERHLPPKLPWIFSKIQGKRIPSFTKILPYIILQWILLGVAYYVLYHGLENSLTPIVGLVQIMANNIGMLALFVPAGLGVREGVMALYFDSLHLSLNVILVATVISRICFVAAEAITYLISLFIKPNVK